MSKKGVANKQVEKIPLLQSEKKKRIKIRTLKARSSKRSPYYDEKDKAAMERLDKARCDWSPQEDSFLLLCKVASSFLDPLFIKNLSVPYTIVRDLLHEHVPEVSANKSSRACQRRVRYMMMNSTTANNVQVFLGEALQDAELVREFDKPKPPKSNEAVWKDMFITVLNKLRDKFTLPASDRCKNIVLPDTLEAFYKSYEIVKDDKVFDQNKVYIEPKNEDEIRKFVLLTLILSAMAATNIDGKNWSYLLHRLYQGYPESLLQSAVAHLRKEKIIAVKKRTLRTDLQRSLKSACPYKFSISYSNAMLTKFPIRLFKESKELLDSLNKFNSDTNVELKGNVPAGYAASILALVTMERLAVHTQIPEQIILFDSSLNEDAKKNIVGRMKHTLNNKESAELSQLLMPSGNAESNQAYSAVVHNNEMKDNPSLDEDENPDSAEVHRSSNASRFALYLLRQELSQPPIERVQHSQDYIVLNSCRVFCRLKTPTHPKLPVNPAAVIEKTPDWDKTAQSEFITRDRMELTKSRISDIVKLLTFKIPPHVLCLTKDHLDLIESLYKQYSPQTVIDAKCIFHYLYEAGCKGISEKDIWKAFLKLPGELSVFHHLQRFRDAVLVIRAGVTNFIYVCTCFANPWVLTSFELSSIQNKNIAKVDKGNDTKSLGNRPSLSDAQDPCSSCTLDSELNSDSHTASDQQPVSSNSNQNRSNAQKIYFIPRTWRHPDGSLNLPVFFDLLSTVLSRIISTPGTPTEQVCEHFSMVLPPVQTLELIEVLEKACCIFKYYCTPVKKTSLFGPPQTTFIKENPEPDDLEHLEPFPDAVCKVAQLTDIFYEAEQKKSCTY